MTSDTIVIQAGRTKTTGLVLLGVIFVVLGIWLIMLDTAEIEAQRRFNNPALVHGLGYVTVAFFGLCLVAAVWRLFSVKPGLTLNSEGITIYAITGEAFIPWHDITGLATYEVHRQKLLVLMLQNPEKYIETGGAVRRWLARANFDLCGSPIAVSSNALQIDYTELHDLCTSYIQRYASRV